MPHTLTGEAAKDKVKAKVHEDNAFKRIHQWAKEDYPMVVSCCDTTEENAPDGLAKNHAYTLLDVAEVQGIKLAKVKNPWSKEGYNGEWSDSDPRWTADLLK